MRKILSFVVVLTGILGVAPALAQQLQALARLDARNSTISERASGDVDIRLALTQGVPFRVFTLDSPTRLVMDFREVEFGRVGADALIKTTQITDMRVGLFQPGWSRMVLVMRHAMAIHSAEMRTDAKDGSAEVNVRLTLVEPDAFTAQSGPRDTTGWELPSPVVAPPAKQRQTGVGPLIVALDPGHGGIDSGARYGGHRESDLMLQLAREIKEKLVLTGRYKAFLTRDDDVFLSLENRVSTARAQGADVFISLHADALSVGQARGTTVYSLSDRASNAAAAALAASHDRADLLVGVDLAAQDDVVATVLMDMARLETEPRTNRLAAKLVLGIAKSVGRIRARPHLTAGFSVLKAPDIPSVLIEFGFMSNPRDLVNLADSAWRAKVITGLIMALDAWTIEDAAEARLLRQ